jgi:hypothetical protein
MNADLPTTFDDLPTYVVAQVSVDCGSYDEPVERHRIWIRRDGQVETIDHLPTNDAVFSALGGVPTHTCAYWMHAAAGTSTRERYQTPPNLESWSFDVPGALWPARAVWTAMAAIVGENAFNTVNPVLALSLAKVYVHRDAYPRDTREQTLRTLITPATREAGFRRAHSADPEEVDAMFALGVPADLVAPLIALGFAPEQAASAYRDSLRIDVPAALILTLASLFNAGGTLEILGSLNSGTATWLPARLMTVMEPQHSLTRAQVAEYLTVGNLPTTTSD